MSDDLRMAFVYAGVKARGPIPCVRLRGPYRPLACKATWSLECCELRVEGVDVILVQLSEKKFHNKLEAQDEYCEKLANWHLPVGEVMQRVIGQRSMLVLPDSQTASLFTRVSFDEGLGKWRLVKKGD